MLSSYSYFKGLFIILEEKCFFHRGSVPTGQKSLRVHRKELLCNATVVYDLGRYKIAPAKSESANPGGCAADRAQTCTEAHVSPATVRWKCVRRCLFAAMGWRQNRADFSEGGQSLQLLETEKSCFYRQGLQTEQLVRMALCFYDLPIRSWGSMGNTSLNLDWKTYQEKVEMCVLFLPWTEDMNGPLRRSCINNKRGLHLHKNH